MLERNREENPLVVAPHTSPDGKACPCGSTKKFSSIDPMTGTPKERCAICGCAWRGKDARQSFSKRPKLG